LKASAFGVGAINFFVIWVAAPLAATAGVFPVAMLLGNGVDIPAPLCVAVQPANTCCSFDHVCHFFTFRS
jgi:hypothetical protein